MYFCIGSTISGSEQCTYVHILCHFAIYLAAQQRLSGCISLFIVSPYILRALPFFYTSTFFFFSSFNESDSCNPLYGPDDLCILFTSSCFYFFSNFNETDSRNPLQPRRPLHRRGGWQEGRGLAHPREAPSDRSALAAQVLRWPPG